MSKQYFSYSFEISLANAIHIFSIKLSQNRNDLRKLTENLISFPYPIMQRFLESIGWKSIRVLKAFTTPKMFRMNIYMWKKVKSHVCYLNRTCSNLGSFKSLSLLIFSGRYAMSYKFYMPHFKFTIIKLLQHSTILVM